MSIVRVYRVNESEELRVTGTLFDQRQLDSMNGQWAGPIPEPTS